MSLNIKLKEVFEPEAQFGAFYTGGTICPTSDGKQCLCLSGGKINVVSTETLAIDIVIGNSGASAEDNIQEDSIYTFALSSDDTTVVTAHRSGLLKLWNRETGKLNKMWKSIHKGPIVSLAFDLGNQLIASGGSDSLIRIWDFENQVCLGTLRGCEGIVNLLHFHPNCNLNVLLAASDNNKIYAWNLTTRQIVKTFEGHFSRVTNLSFTHDFKHFVSAGRDKVLILWEYAKEKQVRTIPVYEALEACFVLAAGIQLPNNYEVPDDTIVCASAGENGFVKIWDMTKSKIVYQQSNSMISKAEEEGGLAITYAFYNPTISQIVLVSADHNIIMHDSTTFECQKQLIGFSDEILDLILVNTSSKKKKIGKNFLVMATNSKDIKLYDTTTMNCNILRGHTEIVLSLAGRQKLIVSGGKDNSVRLWRIEGDSAKCVAYGLKHTECVGSVAISNNSEKFCVSVSQDKCIKIWDLPTSFDDAATEPAALLCRRTTLAHDKDINCVSVAPNDKIIATASQDKTAKLWSADDLSLLGVLRGHRRGLWTIRFSPVDQIVLTSSADAIIKLWSITDMQCLKSLEGHDCSVLKADFLNNGLQIVSAGTDGLIKLWSIKTSECIQTLDKHDSRVWALVVDDANDLLYTGGSDSLVVKWKDVTEEKKLKEIEERQELMLQEQELNNLLSEKKMLKALRLALKLDRPYMTLKIINNVIKQQEEEGLQQTVCKLNDMHKDSLLQHAINWNTNSRNTRPAQLVMNILLKEVLAGTFKVSELQKTVESALPYSERHFTRMTQYLKDLKFVEFTLKCMQPHVALDVEMKTEVETEEV